MIGLDNLTGDLFITKFLHLPSELVIEDIREPFEENQRKDKVLKLWCVRGSPNRASGVPQPRLQHRNIKMLAVQGRHRQHRQAVRFGLLPPRFLCSLRRLRHHPRLNQVDLFEERTLLKSAWSTIRYELSAGCVSSPLDLFRG